MLRRPFIIVASRVRLLELVVQKPEFSHDGLTFFRGDEVHESLGQRRIARKFQRNQIQSLGFRDFPAEIDDIQVIDIFLEKSGGAPIKRNVSFPALNRQI